MTAKKKGIIKRYIIEVIRYKPIRTTGVLVIMIVLMLVTLLQPQVVRQIIDNALGKHNINLLFVLAILYIFIAAIFSLGEFGKNYICSTISLGLCVKIKNRLIKHMTNLDGEFFANKKSGELIKLLDGDTGIVQQFGIDTLFQVIVEIVTAISSFIILFYMQPILLFIVIGIEWLAIILQMHYTKKIAQKTEEMRNKEGEMLSQLEEMSANTMNIIISKMFRMLFGNFIKSERSFVKMNMIRIVFIELSSGIGNILNSSVTALVYVVGGIWVINNRMSLGELIVYTQYVSMLIGPCVSLIQINSQVQQATVSLEKIYDFEDYTVGIKQDNGEKYVTMGDKGFITFKNVYFGYSKREPILENLNMSFEKGKTIALVGNSGSGKSTILKLISRFWDTAEGNIIIEERNIQEFNLRSLRKNISYVTQDVFLCNSSIWENIVIKSNTKRETVEKLCCELGIKDFADTLENKYNTLVGEGGVKLSGGQKQRIAIARALLLDCPIMLFDEATSALDNVSQFQVFNVIKRYCCDKILIVVAHRISTIKDANCIYVIHNGKQVGAGTHDELLKTNKYYQSLENGDSYDINRS